MFLRRISPKSFASIQNQLFKQARSASSITDIKSPTLGSYHWNLERGLSVLSLPLMGTAMVFGTIPFVDLAMGVVLPLHCHIGFDAMIIDYFHERKTPILSKVLTWGLRIATVLTLYGCYVINTKDVGLTALVGQLWTGKSKEKDLK